MQSNRELNHYDKQSTYDIDTRDIGIYEPTSYNVYKLFVGQNKNSDYQQDVYKRQIRDTIIYIGL